MIRRTRFLVRAGASCGLLALLAWLLDPTDVAGRLRDLDASWVGAALLVSMLQVGLSAWRWRYTAGRLGIELPMRGAVAEYYLATFLNQTLPGGVLGDVSRAWRHTRRGGPARAAIQAVAFERLSGSVVMCTVAVTSTGILLGSASGRARGAMALALLLAVLAGAAWLRRVGERPRSPGLLVDLRRALIDGPALPVQLATSCAVAASYLVVFVMAARAVGVSTAAPLLFTLAGPVLMSMLVPVTVAGWGLREAAAAALWSAVGLTAADGVAVAVAYGLIVLVSSLPGAAVMAANLRRPPDRDRTPRPDPAGRAGPPAGWLRRATRSEEA